MSGACGHCGARLWLNGVRRYGAKFCSASCRVAAYRERTGYRPPPKPPKPPREATCIICGLIFSQGGRGRPRMTCGPECAKKKQQADLRAFHERRVADGRWELQSAKRRNTAKGARMAS
jgi:hypothetical protein